MTEEERGYHEVANIFPLLNGQEYEDLKADIAANGLLEPIWLHQDGRIIDGRNRHRACIDTGTPPQFRTWNGRGSLVSFVVSLNLHRRHLTSSQRGAAAVEVEKALQEEIAKDASARAAQSVDSRWTKERIGEELYEALKPGRAGRAQAHNEKIEERRAGQQVYFFVDGDKIKIGVSLDPDERLRQLKTGNPGIEMVGHAPGGLPVERELHKRLADKRINGEWFLFDEETRGVVDEIIRFVNLDKAYARNARQEAAKIVGASQGYVSDAKRLSVAAPELFEQVRAGAITIPQAKREMVKRDRRDAPPLPTDKYRILYADPPWSYGNSGVIGDTDNYGHVGRHYPSMTISELCDMGGAVREIIETDAVLFMWVTSPLLEECFSVIRAWGFKYKTSFVWDKVRHNFGHYNSVRHELLLVCTRGSCTPDDSRLVDSVQTIERSDVHSEKPEEFRNIIDTLYSHGRRLEMFARQPADGWEMWGNE